MPDQNANPVLPDLNSLRSTVESSFPDFGPNKIREIMRLVFEISKRENSPINTVLDSIPKTEKFPQIKKVLVSRRYPELTKAGVVIKDVFPGLDMNPVNAVNITHPISREPKIIYIEKRAAGSSLAERIKGLFPRSSIQIIDSYKSFSQSRDFVTTDYNRRLENFFLVKEEYDFFKTCPCSNGALSCGYHNANFGLGCPFECSYCFLQDYSNSPGIVFPVNLDDFFRSFESYPSAVRVGSGQNSDSLAWDHITQFSPRIVEYFRRRPDSFFEFKTKSDNISCLLSVKPAPNIVIGWSLNPQKIIDREEFFTASLAARLSAACKCAGAGYSTAFHFDPIFYYPRWEDDYASLVSLLFSRVPKESIAWISLGTLRMTVRQKKMIENRFPENTILDAELIIAPDGKIRYHEAVRRKIYETMLRILGVSISPRTRVYLCMEPQAMTLSLGLR